MKAYKFKLKPCKKAAKLATTLDLCRELYNAGLQERRDAYKLQKKSLNYFDQANQLSDIKALRDDVKGLHSQVLQDVLKRLDKAFQAFFRRVKDNPAQAGFPRFKGQTRYNSFTYPQSGFRLEGNKLIFSKIGSCRLRLSRPVEGKIKTCSIKRQVEGWFVIFTVEENQCQWIPKTGESVGVDVGIENFATLSTGEVVENPRYYRQAERELKSAQCQVSKKKRGGKNRHKARKILAKKHQRVANLRRDFFHKTTNQLLREFDEIAVEDLHIKGLVRNHHLAKSISDASWGTFLSGLESKAANAGRRVWIVPPQFTSQDCSRCGNRVKKSLSVREHRCIGCGFVTHHDHNAALNIKARIAPFARVGVALPNDQRIPVL